VIKLCENLHPNKLFSYLLKFGFRTKTEVDINGEANGKLAAPGTWSGLSKASISIGYEVGVTALQITTAYCAIVNGGMLPIPYIVSQVETPVGRKKTVNKPNILRQVISPEVSDILKIILKNAVVRGTGTKARINEIEVGGKTGTAQKINLKDGGYYRDKYLSSFIGFAPFEKPKFVCSVFIDEPKKGYYGGDVAAPVFKAIIENIIGLPSVDDLSEPIDLPIAEADKSVPPLKSVTIKNATKILEQRGRKYEVAGLGSFVEDVEVKNNVIFLKTGPKEIKLTKMPNLKGLSVREALRILDFSKLRVLIKGDGLVQRQSIKAGKQLDKYSTLILTCN
jgi:membrane peptidoglycan carboxypeptidase